MAGTWQRLVSISADGTSTTLTTSAFTAKDNLHVIIYARSAVAGNYQVRFNGDASGGSSGNYATRRNYDGANEGTFQSDKFISYSATSALSSHITMDISNEASKEKLVIGESVENSATGVNTAPNRVEFIGKCVNTSDQVTTITVLTNSGSNLTSDSYITVYGASEDTVTDEKTTLTNVPANTRYEETDTRKIWRKVTPTQASYTNDFSSSTGWTLGSGHTISGNKLSGTFTSGGDRSYLDVSSVNISDDTWVLRFGLKITATNTSSVNVLSMGLVDSTAVGSATFGAGDDFSAVIYTSDSQKYNMRAMNGGSQVFYERSTSTPVTNTQYYVELKKISDTSATLRFYDNSDYTAGSNALELLSNTGDTSGLTNLDYFMIKPYDTSSGSHTIEISDLKIYSGISSVDTDEWKERNTAT